MELCDLVMTGGGGMAGVCWVVVCISGRVELCDLVTARGRDKVCVR